MRTKQEIQTAFAPAETFSASKTFFLVGIGGAGMSGLARMLKNRGLDVRGSDSNPSPITAELETLGIPVRIGHFGDGIREGDQLVLSDAIPLDESPEVAAARKLECPLFRRSQLLGWLLRDKKVIAVTGTHGKTTTTGMIGAGLRAAGMDPTIVVGAEVPEFGGAVVEGRGEWAVVEACEAYDSFHDLTPTIVVLTNLEPDHLDYHGTFENLKESVKRFVEKVPDEGALLYCGDDSGAADLAKQVTARGEEYRRDQLVQLASYDPDLLMFSVQQRGIHNESNAAGALVACEVVGAEMAKCVMPVLRFGGAERRQQILQESPLEFIGDTVRGVDVIDDYAHHPTEVRATLEAVRFHWFQWLPGRKRLIVVFQPHLYSRTAEHLEAFAEALSLADLVVLTDIYPAREKPMPGMSAARIAELVTKPVRYIPSRHLLPREVAKMTRPGDVVVGMGAGNISEFAPALVEELKRIGGYGGRPIEEWGRPLKVAVIYGGDSAEREVSLHSGRAVAEALGKKGYEYDLFDVSDLLLSKGDLAAFKGPNRPDLAFLCVHGTNAEDGAFQGLFEMLHIPYTGSGLQSSAIAMDKQLTKQVLEARGIKVPMGRLFSSVEELDVSLPRPLPSRQAGTRKHFPLREKQGRGELQVPLVVKPNAQGSTVGLSFVRSAEELATAVEKALAYGSGALIEELIEGVEVSVPVLGDRALPPVEIVPDSGQYDFAAKYTPGATNEICPARLPAAMLDELKRIALEAHRALGCRGATRTDMIVRNDDVFVLEVNTLPGMTPTSLLPRAAGVDGISFEDLCDWIVRNAMECHAKET
ncbi:MAG: UDP-N-acetylmuramate--L-alanine ligase [Armatimonadetes bacterium]|nr:UDP-N-acetylmuramate--L-alanine ligase [Armatimonadota bacterium]